MSAYVCVCLYLCVSKRGNVCERGRWWGREVGEQEASRKWGWRGRVRIFNRMRMEEKYVAQESHEPERLPLLPYPMCTAIIPSSNWLQDLWCCSNTAVNCTLCDMKLAKWTHWKKRCQLEECDFNYSAQHQSWTKCCFAVWYMQTNPDVDVNTIKYLEGKKETKKHACTHTHVLHD